MIPTRSTTSNYVYTPNGTPVQVYTFDELPPEYIDDLNEYGDTLVPDATRVGPSTSKYNCHSYAWYMQSTLNTYWMNYPYEYYTDGSYEESTGDAGDIICYFDEYGENLHSGIVIARSTGTSNGVCGDSNLVTVKSKWGACGLYEHRGDQCPYTSTYYGDATYVCYYKPRINDAITLSNPSSNNTEIIQKFYTVPTNSNIQNNYALYGLDVVYRKTYNFEISSGCELNVRFYDEHMHLVTFNMTSNYENGVYRISFRRYLNVGYYYLRVAYDDNSDYGTINTKIVNEHSHSYGSPYLWWSLTQHRSTCECGSTHLEPHVVSPGSFNPGDQTATCILCGGLASIGMQPASLNNYPTSLNGSFILPNGVIVLVDEDIDAYLNGTLVFNYLDID
ncbi:MAG TPA: hypothetical protein GX010_03960 [Erysipelotrichaceae bacterium]|nr:hypothetical protein [Erysipelotrichaceae bacterium]